MGLKRYKATVEGKTTPHVGQSLPTAVSGTTEAETENTGAPLIKWTQSSLNQNGACLVKTQTDGQWEII